MATTYTPTATWSANINIPEDGDDADAAAWNPAVQELADNIAFLNKPASTSGNVYPLASQTLLRFAGFPIGMAADIANGGYLSSRLGDVVFNNTTDAIYATYAIDPPDGCKIMDADVWVDPQTHSALPATMPKLHFYAMDEKGVATFHGVEDDAAATVGAYNAAHAIHLSLGTGVLTDRAASKYLLMVEGERGVNAHAGLVVHLPTFSIKVTSQDPGAG